MRESHAIVAHRAFPITLVALLAAAALPGRAEATINFLTQTRTIFVHAGSSPSGDQTHSAPDFLPYSHSLTADDAPNFDANASSSQTSSLAQTAALFDSTVHTQSFTVADTARATSLLTITFTTTLSTPFGVSGLWMVPPSNPSRVDPHLRLLLQEDATTLYDVDYSFFAPPASGTFSSTGMLLPGHTYTYTVSLQQSSQQFSATTDARVQATLQFVPAPSAAIGLLGMTAACTRRRRSR